MDVPAARRGADDIAVALIGVACGLGARDSGCGDGPAALRAFGLHRRLADAGIGLLKDRTLAVAGLAGADAVADICRLVARLTADAVAANARFAVVGGDHSCAAGSWAGAADALAARGPLGLIWVDAHMDSHTPETTPSGTLHGMPVAALLGCGGAALTGIARRVPALDPAHLCLVGVRSFEPEEPALLDSLGVRVFRMEDIRRLGLAAVIREASAIALDGTAGAGISIDLDAIDPGAAPGVGSPVPGGLDAGELVDAMARIGRDPRFIGCEIAEYNPALDDGCRTAEIAVRLLEAFLGGPLSAARR
ncbi:MAG: arginase [Alphaproteobacteria bacterium]|nr:arginase [Alphaproteobacteria bacterium]